MADKSTGGEETSKERPSSHSKGRLVRIRYRDHVIFRRADPSVLTPCIREVVGWLVRETEDELCICFDRTIGVLPHERPSKESGLAILKCNIIEKWEAEEKWKSWQ